MNILHIHMFDQLSGVQKVSLDEFREAYGRKENINYFLVTNGRQTIADIEAFSKVSSELNVRTFSLTSLNNSFSVIFKIHIFIRLYKLIKRYEINIVHSHSTIPGFICKILSLFFGRNTAFVHTVHGTAWHKFAIVRNAINIFEILTSIGLNAIICMRSSDFELLQPFYKNKVHFIYNSAFTLLPIKSNALDGILWIGRYEKQKNPLFAVDVASWIVKQSDVGKIVFFGDGSLKSRMIQNARSDINRIEINSWTANIKTEFYKSRYLLVTSLYEGMPLIILEAMSHGLCVVSIDYPGVHDLLDNERGIIISASTSKEFSVKFIEAIKTRDIEEIQNNAYYFAKNNFAHSRRYELLNHIYKNIV